MCMEGSTVLRREELVHDLLAETSHRGVKSPRRLTPSVFPVNLGLRGHTDLQLFVFYMINTFAKTGDEAERLNPV